MRTVFHLEPGQSAWRRMRPKRGLRDSALRVQPVARSAVKEFEVDNFSKDAPVPREISGGSFRLAGRNQVVSRREMEAQGQSNDGFGPRGEE